MSYLEIGFSEGSVDRVRMYLGSYGLCLKQDLSGEIFDFFDATSKLLFSLLKQRETGRYSMLSPEGNDEGDVLGYFIADARGEEVGQLFDITEVGVFVRTEKPETERWIADMGGYNYKRKFVDPLNAAVRDVLDEQDKGKPDIGALNALFNSLLQTGKSAAERPVYKPPHERQRPPIQPDEEVDDFT